MAPFQSVRGVLYLAQLLVRVVRWHEEWLVDLEAPAATLDWTVSRFLREVAIHGELHLLFVIWNRGMNFAEFPSNFGAEIPAETAADNACTETVDASVCIAEHDSEVFWDIVQEHMQWLSGS